MHSGCVSACDSKSIMAGRYDFADDLLTSFVAFYGAFGDWAASE
jgi:hypothetical protein